MVQCPLSQYKDSTSGNPHFIYNLLYQCQYYFKLTFQKPSCYKTRSNIYEFIIPQRDIKAEKETEHLQITILNYKTAVS